MQDVLTSWEPCLLKLLELPDDPRQPGPKPTHPPECPILNNIPCDFGWDPRFLIMITWNPVVIILKKLTSDMSRAHFT